MEVNRTEKITFRCTALEKAALAEQAARCGISTSEYCRTLALGGRPKERYTEEERELFREIARLKGTLQRLNNYFGGRQYREVFVQEMKPYFVDFPNVKNNCLRFEVSPSVEESAGMTDADWAKLGNDFMQRMGLMNHQYIIVKHSGTEKNRRQAHLHILANRVSLSGELYKDNWIGKRATEAANGIARERNLVQSKDIGKANREEIKQAMDGILARMQGFDLAGFSRELEKLGFRVREARASTGKLNGYYVTSRSGTEYKASEIGKGYTLAHIEKTQKNLKYNSISRNYGNTLKPKDGGLHL
ncbi:mobilization protein MbpB [Bacteroides thetaiotaomicron]|nr:mobilization protein MbpB [Bacteroides thetaiotaomicron]MCS2716635.1 relaxase/mobilization nuclease domain-containing protein [Bacteroides thetaiotaomicron]